MKKLISIAAFVLASLFSASAAHAQTSDQLSHHVYDMYIMQLNAAQNGYYGWYVNFPATTTDCLLAFDSTNATYPGQPVAIGFGTGILWDHTNHIIKFDSTILPTAAPLIQRIRVQTNSSGSYTWTYPTAFGAGVVPVISVVAEGGATVPLNVQISAAPTNTSVTVQVLTLPSTSLLGIVVLGAPAGAQAYVDITATAP
jgi:hypothetical protein